MIREHGFIEYIFRDFDVALMMYDDCATQLLQDVMVSLMNMKTQSVTQPIIMLFITVVVLIVSDLIPDIYRPYILMFMAAALAAIFWRLFKSS